MRLEQELTELGRCPHCGTARPTFKMRWKSNELVLGANKKGSRWAVYACTTCGNIVSAKGKPNDNTSNAEIVELYPKPKQAPDELPESARKYLQQAYDSLGAPDAAALMAGSAVDAMLKDKGYEKGSLYSRIDKAVEDHVLTKDMGTWAHAVRLGANRPRHVNAESPHVSVEEAQQSVEFADALGQFLFVLSNRVKLGLATAKSTGAPE